MIKRALGAVVTSVALIALVGSATVAVEPGHTASDNGCHGVVNAYAHAADPALDALRAVASRLDCDLDGVERVAKPGQGPDGVAHSDADTNETDEPDDELDEGYAGDEAGPDIQAKCDQINQKLAAAQARPHGKSAVAFERQATRWECGST
jgi:hypothetical protein